MTESDRLIAQEIDQLSDFSESSSAPPASHHIRASTNFENFNIEEQLDNYAYEPPTAILSPNSQLQRLGFEDDL